MIEFCTAPSKWCDYTQFGSDKNHPHASQNRGVFLEETDGGVKFLETDWDIPGIRFDALIEFKAIDDHMTGKLKWRDSIFAKRNLTYLTRGNAIRGLENPETFLLDREREIDSLINSIRRNNVQPAKCEQFIDNISVNIGRNGIYFNNRGHHRLAIAKVLGLNEVPVKISCAYSQKLLDEFLEKRHDEI